MKSAAAEFHRVHAKVRPILGTCAYGLAASIAAVGFQLAINWVYRHAFRPDRAHFLLVSLIVIVTTSLVVGWLLTPSRRERRAAEFRR